ncbi:MAG: hypothetical protein L0215_14630 [Gemmataceae bacterium]|nr:hypothetical protein [Gemmataceae bacterium]
MKKRRLLRLAATSVLLLGAGYGVLWLTAGPRHRINHESFNRIQEGMTEKDVEAIFGVPAGDYTTGPVMELKSDSGFSKVWRVDKPWMSNFSRIYVAFDERGLVVWKRYLPVVPEEESFGDKLRRWLRIN